MQSKKHDDLRQRQRLKEELKDESKGSEQSTPPHSEGLSGEGAASVMAHIRDLEQKRSDNPD